MELAALIFGFVGQLIANITVVPSFSKRYPTATIWFNVTAATLNSINAILNYLVYKAKPATSSLLEGNSGDGVRASFVASLVASLLSILAAIPAVTLHGGRLRFLGALVIIAGIVASIRIGWGLITGMWSGPSSGASGEPPVTATG